MVHVLLALVSAHVLESQHSLLICVYHALVAQDAGPEHEPGSRKGVPIDHIIAHQLVQLEQCRLR